MKHLFANTYVRVLLPSFAGFLFYGTWAGWINYSHGFDKAINAALTQGGYSFVITLVLAIMIETLFTRLARLSFISVVWRCAIVFLLAMTLLAITSVGINVLTGTPEILLTVLPGLVFSGVYTVGYIFTLKKIKVDHE